MVSLSTRITFALPEYQSYPDVRRIHAPSMPTMEGLNPPSVLESQPGWRPSWERWLLYPANGRNEMRISNTSPGSLPTGEPAHLK
jgi:hypothetical protein